MHNIPALILLVVLLISWKHEIVGGIVFILGGLIYIGFMIYNALFKSYSFIIAGPAFFIGILFLICWNKKRK